MFFGDTFYPIISTHKLQETVAFYKDHFEFETLFKEDGYEVIQRAGKPKSCIGIINPEHPAINEQMLGTTVAGTLINFFVDNVDLAYQQLSWSGIPITKDITPSTCGRRYFLVKDPNGLIVTVVEYEQSEAINKRTDKIAV